MQQCFWSVTRSESIFIRVSSCAVQEEVYGTNQRILQAKLRVSHPEHFYSPGRYRCSVDKQHSAPIVNTSSFERSHTRDTSGDISISELSLNPFCTIHKRFQVLISNPATSSSEFPGVHLTTYFDGLWGLVHIPVLLLRFTDCISQLFLFASELGVLLQPLLIAVIAESTL